VAALDFSLRTARFLASEEALAAARGQGRASLNAGAAGIAAYLAEVARVLHEPWALEGARRWLRAARGFAARGPEAFGTASSRARGAEGSLLVGAAGLAWATLVVADAAGDRAARARALVDLERGMARAQPSGDLVLGRAAYAEAGRALLAQGDLTAEEARAAGRMVQAGERCALRHARGDLALEPLLPVAHGAAGMLLVLAGSPAHAAFARGRVEELAGLGRRESSGLQGYPLGAGVPMGGFLGSWCNGVTGLLQLFVRTARQDPSPVIERALVDCAITAARLRARGPSLCCGSAGRALFLLDVAELLGEAAFRRRARTLLASATNQSHREDPSLFYGQAGIAWVALIAGAPGARRPVLFA
jgi:hypothetical protein